MNEQAINNVISGFAIDNANLKIQNATISIELEQTRAEINVLKETLKEDEQALTEYPDTTEEEA